MAFQDRPGRQIAGVHADAPADNLFFTEYRCWMAGFKTRDAACWDYAWDALVRAVSKDFAKVLFSEFHLFARTLRDEAKRDIAWRTDVCRCLCYDECLVLALVSASQLHDQPQEVTLASGLLGTDKVETFLEASRSLAEAMKNCQLLLEPARKTVLGRLGLQMPETRVLH
jgi:hypothetical protein